MHTSLRGLQAKPARDCLDWALLADKCDLAKFWVHCKEFIVKHTAVSFVTPAPPFLLSACHTCNQIIGRSGVAHADAVTLFFFLHAKQDKRMALLSGNAVYDIFKAHMAGPSISVSAEGDEVTIDVPSLTCDQEGCKGGVKVLVYAHYRTARVFIHQCKKCGKRW